MINKVSKNETRKRRHARVRAKVSGTATCPRLNVFRSNSHIFAQIIDDTNGTTLVSSSSLALKLVKNLLKYFFAFSLITLTPSSRT